jgi:Na+/H+ antiporter NhaD/arsenite permease-like protein
MFLGIPLEFLLFGTTLLGVALFHHHTLYVALGGMLVITLYKLGVAGFSEGPGIGGLLAHFLHEWVTLANLLGLLIGFALLSDHFEKSQVPDVLPKFLPDDWKGGFVLLVLVFVLSSFLDNIAAALIGATIAQTVFRHKVHIGYVAAIVAASNAGGSGSVVGDTTTTMMWLAGISPIAVFPAYIAAVVALVVCGIPAALQQHKYQPILKHERRGSHVEWTRLGIVGFILAAAIAMNVYANQSMGPMASKFPWLGLAVWAAILVSAPLRAPNWALVPGAAKGALFLLSLVFAASLMPVDQLPPASWQSAFALGFVSAVFDNIPLTALAIKQGGFDWGVLAYSVGFGGSMLWFGSSAGVAVSGMFDGAKSAGAWLRGGWHVVLAYVVGFLVMLLLWGWHPSTQSVKPSAGDLPFIVQHHSVDQYNISIGDKNGRYFPTTQTQTGA